MRTWTTTAASSRISLASSAVGCGSYSETVIYCVIPKELEGDLFEKMVDYYKDNPNVTVIIDRRTGPDRRAGKKVTDAEKEQRQTRDRRRARIPGTFPETDAPSE